MAYKTKRYQLYTFGAMGDIYSCMADKLRTQIIENQLSSCFDIIGGGVVKGLNVFIDEAAATPTTSLGIIVEEGFAIAPFTATITIPPGPTQIDKQVHVAVKVQGKDTKTLTLKNGIAGVFIKIVNFASDQSPPSPPAMHKIIIEQNIVRYAITDTSLINAYLQYTIDGDVGAGSSLNVLVNSNKLIENVHYTLDGNFINFKSRRFPSDNISVQVTPKDSLLLALVHVANEKIIAIDNSVKQMVVEQLRDDYLADRLKIHSHNGTYTKVNITTSTNYVIASQNTGVDKTIYEVRKAELLDDEGKPLLEQPPYLLKNTAFAPVDIMAFNGTVKKIEGNKLQDTANEKSFINYSTNVDNLNGYILNPNTKQNKTYRVISNSRTELYVDGIIDCAIAGDDYLVVPYEVSVLINEKEEFYGYYVVSDDNEVIRIKFNGLFDSSDTVKIKLYYVQTQLETIGTLDVSKINFGGDIFKLGSITESLLPDLYHAGRVDEIMFPIADDQILLTLDPSLQNSNCWASDTLDNISYKARNENANSLRDVLWVEKVGNYIYACANNTILKASSSRLFNCLKWEYDGYPEMFRPVKIVKQSYEGSVNLYAFNDKFIYYRNHNIVNGVITVDEDKDEWDVFIGIFDLGSDSSYINPNIITILDEDSPSSTFNDLASDSLGNLYLATDKGLFFYNQVENKGPRMWNRILSSNFNCLSVVICNENNGVGDAIFVAIDSGAGRVLYRSLSKPNKVFQAIDQSDTSIFLEDAFQEDGQYIISGFGKPPLTIDLTADLDIGSNYCTLTEAIGSDYPRLTSFIVKDFENLNVNAEYKKCLFKNKNQELIINNKYCYNKIANVFEDVPISANNECLIGHYISHYVNINGALNETTKNFDNTIDYFCLINEFSNKNYGGIYRTNINPVDPEDKEDSSRLNNICYYTALTDIDGSPILHSNFIYEDVDEDDFYICSDDGILHCSDLSGTQSHLIVRNAMSYFGKPLNVYSNVFKPILRLGCIGFKDDSNNYIVNVSFAENSLNISYLCVLCDLSTVFIGDYIYFTIDGGGNKIGKYFRILNIRIEDARQNKYYILIDSFDGTNYEIADFRYGETFDVVPHLPPLPVINGIPQKETYNLFFNDYNQDYYPLQRIDFQQANAYYDDVIVATEFKYFIPKYGSWDETKDYDVFLNGKNIKNINGYLSDIKTYSYREIGARASTQVTKLIAKNAVFKNLSLAGQRVVISRLIDGVTAELFYTIKYNDESSLIIDGNETSTITNYLQVSASNILYKICLVTPFRFGDKKYDGIFLAANVSSNDTVTISIKETYISDAGEYNHEEIEDNFSEEESGLPYFLDGTRNANFLQAINSIKDFVYSFPEAFGENIEIIKFTDSDYIDLVNSTIENSKLKESTVAEGEYAYNVFGLLHSAKYGGLYALTENGVFFKANSSIFNQNPRWAKKADFIDTLNAEGIPVIDESALSGFYIGYDKNTLKWQVSWGGFREGNETNDGLNNIKIISVKIDKLNQDIFYIATEENGIFKTIDNGVTFRNIFNSSAFDYENNLVKDFVIHYNRQNVLFVLTETGLHKSYDGGSNFNLISKNRFTEEELGEGAEVLSLINQERENFVVKTFINQDNTSNGIIAFSSNCIYYRKETDDVVDSAGELDWEFMRGIGNPLQWKFSKILANDIMFCDTSGFKIYDIVIDNSNNNNVYIATNYGVFMANHGLISGENNNEVHYLVVENPVQVVENNRMVSYITIEGTLSELGLVEGNYILPDSLSHDYYCEVIAVEQITETQIKIKVWGKIFDRNATPLAKKNGYIAVNKWKNISKNISNLMPKTICLDYNNSTMLFCGTEENGIYLMHDVNLLGDWEKINNGLGIVSEDVVVNINKICSFDDGTVYAALRSSMTFEGGLFLLQNDNSWESKMSGDVLTFDVYDDKIVVGTSTAFFESEDSGENWAEFKMPCLDILTLEASKNDFGTFFAGTNGGGLFKGIDFGNKWTQSFSKEGVLNEVKANLFNIMKISDSSFNGVNSIFIEVASQGSGANQFNKIDAGKKFKFINLQETNDFLWTRYDSETYFSPLGRTMWIDASNYSFLSKQKLSSNLPTTNVTLGVIINTVCRDQYASERIFASISDHCVFGAGYLKTDGSALSRQGGGFLLDGFVSNTFQGSNVVSNRCEEIRSPREFGVKSMVFDSSDDDYTSFFVGTENAGFLKLVLHKTFRYIAGNGLISKVENVYWLEDINISSNYPYPRGICQFDSSITGSGYYGWMQNYDGHLRNFDISGYTSISKIEISGFSQQLGDGDICKYIISSCRLKSVNSQTTFNADISDEYYFGDAICAPFDKENIGENEIFDTVIIQTLAGSYDTSKFANGKLFYAPQLTSLKARSFTLTETSFSIDSVVDDDEVGTFELKLKTADILNKNGDNFVEVNGIIFGEEGVYIYLSDDVKYDYPFGLDGTVFKNLRLQLKNVGYVDLQKSFFRITKLSSYNNMQCIIVDNTNNSFYEFITKNGTVLTGFYARINFGFSSISIIPIALNVDDTVNNTVVLPVYIAPCNEMQYLNEGLTLNDYEEVKNSFNKLLNFTNHVVALAPPTGILSFSKDSCRWLNENFPDNYIMDIDSYGSEADSNIVVAAKNKIYKTTYLSPVEYGICLSSFVDITPNLSEYNFSFVRFGKTNSEFYVGLTRGGMLYSSDLGETYSSIKAGLDDFNVPQWKFAYDSLNENVYAYGFNAGIFLFNKLSKEFEDISNGLKNINISSLSPCGDIIYAASFGGGIFKTEDAGTTWTALPIKEFKSKLIRNISCFPDNPSIVLAFVQRDKVYLYKDSDLSYQFDNDSSAIYKSINGGGAWEVVSISVGDGDIGIEKCSSLACFDGGICFVGIPGKSLYKSFNYAKNFSEVLVDALPYTFEEFYDIEKTKGKTNEFFVLGYKEAKMVLLFSFDSSVTWGDKILNAQNKYFSISPYSNRSYFSLSNKSTIISSCALRGGLGSFDNSTEGNMFFCPDGLLQHNNNEFSPDIEYVNFEGAYFKFEELSVGGASLSTKDIFGATTPGWFFVSKNKYNLSKTPMFPANGTGTPLGSRSLSIYGSTLPLESTFQIGNITYIKITLSPVGDTDFIKLCDKNGSLVGLYIQIGQSFLYKISASYYESDTLFLYIVGDCTLADGVYNICIGTNESNAIAPITYIPSFATGMATSLNYLSSYVNYTGNFAFNEGSVDSVNIVLRDFYFYNDYFYLFMDEQYVKFSTSDLLSSAYTPFNPLKDLAAVSLVPLSKGCTCSSINKIFYITTQYYVYYNNRSDDPNAEAYTKIANRNYRNIYNVNIVFSNILYPLTVNKDKEDIAFMMVDTFKLLFTEKLSDWCDEADIWQERSLPFLSNDFDSNAIRNIVIRNITINDSVLSVAIMCFGNYSYEFSNPWQHNGFYYSLNNGSSWPRINLKGENNKYLFATDVAISSESGKFAFATLREKNNLLIADVYTNVVGTYGDNVLSTISISDNVVLIGTDCNISLVDVYNNTCSHYENPNKTGFKKIVEISFKFFAIGTDNKIYIFSKPSNNIDNAFIRYIDFGNVVVNDIVYTLTDVYIATENGVRSIAIAMLNHLIASNSLSSNSFQIIAQTSSINAKTICIKNEGGSLDIWIGTNGDGLYKLNVNAGTMQRYMANYVGSNFINAVASKPKSICSIGDNGIARFLIPSTEFNDYVLITKTYIPVAPSYSINSFPTDGIEYKSSKKCVIRSGTIDSTAETTTFTIDAINFSDCRGSYLFINGKNDHPYFINSLNTTGTEIVINEIVAVLQQGTPAIICQLIASNTCVIYSGVHNNSAEIIDELVATNEKYSYGIYYYNSSIKKYYPSIEFDLIYYGTALTKAKDNIFILINNALIRYDYSTELFETIYLKATESGDFLADFALDSWYNLNIICKISGKIVKINDIKMVTYQSGREDGPIYNSINSNKKNIYCNSSLGLEWWETPNAGIFSVKKYIDSDYYTYVLSDPNIKFSKILSIKPETSVYRDASIYDIKYDSNDNLYIFCWKKLYIINIGSFETDVIAITSAFPLFKSVFGANYEIATISERQCFVCLDYITPNSVFLPAIKSQNVPMGFGETSSKSQLFDGRFLYVSTDQNQKYHFPYFDFVNDTDIYKNYCDNVNSKFLSGIMPASPEGLITSKVADAVSATCSDGKRYLWVATKNNLYYSLDISSLVFTKIDLPLYVSRFNTNGSIISLQRCNYIRGGNGIFVCFKNGYTESDLIDRANTLNQQGTCVLYLDILEDDNIITHLISNGYFDEKEPFSIFEKSFGNIMDNNQLLPYVKTRYQVCDFPKLSYGIDDGYDCVFPDIISCNSFGQIERILSSCKASFDDTKTGDIAYKLINLFSNNFIYSANNKQCSNIYDMLEYYRPYRSFVSAIDPQDSDVLYLPIFNPLETPYSSGWHNPETDSCQLLKTYDGGKNWFETNMNSVIPSNSCITDISIDPTNHDTIYVSVAGYNYSENGVFVSKDGGINFIDISNNLPELPALSIHLQDDATTGGKLYVGILGNGLYKRDASIYGYGYGYEYGYGYGYEIEGGDFFDVFGLDHLNEQWTKHEPRFSQRYGLDLTNEQIVDITIGNQNKNLIYMITKENGILKSVDGGAKWQIGQSCEKPVDLDGEALVLDENKGIPFGTVMTKIEISPIDDSVIWLGTTNGLYSTNNQIDYWEKNLVFAEENIKNIIINKNYQFSFISFLLEKPDIEMDNFIIIKKENCQIGFVPAPGISISSLKVGGAFGDAILVHIGQLSDFDGDGLFEFVDATNIKNGIFYYYVIYSCHNGVCTKFPNEYTGEVHGFTSNTVSINIPSGTVYNVIYDSYNDLSLVYDNEVSSYLALKNWKMGFGPWITNKTITFSKEGFPNVETSVADANYDCISLEGDYTNLISGYQYLVDVKMEINKYKGHVINANTIQYQLPSNFNEELWFSILSNTENCITVILEHNNMNIGLVPGMGAPAYDDFLLRESVNFTILSTRKLMAQYVNLVYILTNEKIYYTVDNGKSFLPLTTPVGVIDGLLGAGVESEAYNYISFETQDKIHDYRQVKMWIAGDNGLYYTETGFTTINEDKSHFNTEPDEGKYLFVQIDEQNSHIIYAYKENTGLLRSINGGIQFSLMPLSDEIKTKLIASAQTFLYFKHYLNNILVGTEGNGIIKIKDSTKDKFDVNIDTDVSFSDFDYSSFKICDDINTDVNSIRIKSVVKAMNSNNVNSIFFETSGGKYVYFDLSYQDMKPDNTMVKIGSQEYHPNGIPFRLRIPNTTLGDNIGFSISELIDGTIAVGTNKGCYFSADGNIFSKVDNFLIPDIIYVIYKTNDGHLYIGTNNGLWENNDISKLSEFSPKYKTGYNVRSFWKYNDGIKKTLFLGGSFGLIIQFFNYDYLTITTPNNFESRDGIQFSWGVENEDGSMNPGGIDDKTLSSLNRHQYFLDLVTREYVDKLGWTGTIIVRNEGDRPVGFIPSKGVTYFKGDRRYVDAIRINHFDVTPEGQVEQVIQVVPFEDGMVIADDIRAVTDRSKIGYTASVIAADPVYGNYPPDTFTLDEMYKDTTHVTADPSSSSILDDYVNEFGAHDDSLQNTPLGAMLKPSTTYTYSLFAYYERVANFVIQGESLMRAYTPLKIKQFNVLIPIHNFPNATTIKCGLSVHDNFYIVGTDDGIFYTDYNVGLIKSEYTDNYTINNIINSEEVANFYAYGYGYDYAYLNGLDFFDVFGEEGTLYGYSFEGPYIDYGYGYSYGYEQVACEIIFAATNKGVLMSVDGARSFVLIFNITDYKVDNVLCVEKTIDNDILIGTNKGIFTKDKTDHYKWDFNSIVGSVDSVGFGKFLGQNFDLS